MIWISELTLNLPLPNVPPPRSRTTTFSPSEPSMSGFRTSRTGRKPRASLERVASVRCQMRGALYPRLARPDSELLVVSCPNEYICLKFLDISVVLVQHLVPFVALWYAVLGIVRAYATTSHGRRTQRISHAAEGVAIFRKSDLRNSDSPSLPYALWHNPPQTGCGHICSAAHTPQ